MSAAETGSAGPTGESENRPEDGSDIDPKEKSDNNGLIYGMIGGMMLGVVLVVLFDQILWLAIGVPLGMAVGALMDSQRR